MIILGLTFLFSCVNAQTPEKQNSTTFLQKFKSTCWRADDHWLAKDKVQHFTTSTMIFLTNYYYESEYTDFSDKALLKNAYTLSISMGIGKEILDFTGPKKYFSFKDLIADVAGNVAGHLIVNNIK